MDDDSIPYPQEFIAPLPELLERLPGKLKAVLPGKSAAPYPFNESGDLRRLHEFRNDLVHFRPTSWSLELAGLPRILASAVGLTDQIIHFENYPRWNRFLDIPVDGTLRAIENRLEAFTESH
jgi:hypothetical protein